MGADHTLTLRLLLPEAGFYTAFCDLCGHTADGVVVDPYGWGLEHATRMHRGAGLLVESAA